MAIGCFFIENKGQIVDNNGKARNDIICYINLKGFDAYITGTGLSFVWEETAPTIDSTVSIYRNDVVFSSSNMSDYQLDDRNNALLNLYISNKNEGITDIHTFHLIRFRDIYPDIDLVIKTENNKLELIYILKDGASPEKINITNSEMNTSNFHPELYFSIKYINSNDYIDEVENSNKHNENHLQEYKNIQWSTYYGGNGDDFILRILTDDSNNIYVGGETRSTNFPTTPGVYQTTNRGDLDAFISKFSLEGKLIWSTLFGGSGFDTLNDLELTKDSTIWYCGETRSGDYPVTSNAFQATYHSGTADGAFGKFTNDGKRLYISYYGGSDYESLNELAVNSKGDVFITGPTASNNFPVSSNAIRQSSTGGYEGFIIGFDKYYNRLYASYWGGSIDDFGEGITVDNNDNIVILGYTNSKDYFTKNPYQPTLKGGMDGYIAKFDSSFHLIWSSYLGGSGNDYSNKVINDDNNNLFLRGCTTSKDLPTTNNAIQKGIGGKTDNFLMKYNENGTLLMATYFGGSGEEGWDHVNAQFGGIDLDANGNVVISAITKSTDLKISSDAMQPNLGGNNPSESDAYILIVDNSGNMLYSSYLGGSKSEKGYDINFDNKDNLLHVGYTYSNDFPIVGDAYQKVMNSMLDGYILKFGYNNQPKDTCDETAFEFLNFTNDENIRYDGKAYLEQSYIRLTRSSLNRVGAAWYKYQMPLRNGFTTTFSFRMTEGVKGTSADSSCAGADGIAFVIQNNVPLAHGIIGGRIGYDPIPNSLAVEYDLFSNDENQIEILGDPNGNHVAVMSLGKQPNSSNHGSGAQLALAKDVIEMKSDATVYYSKIDYNIKEGAFRVWLSEDKDNYGNPIIEINNFNLTQLLGLDRDEWAFVGFTSATGNSYQNHDIKAWDFCPKQTESQQTGVEDENNANDMGIRIYPNPVEDFLNISGEDITSVTIYNILGETVKCCSVPCNGAIDVSDLPKGCYLVNVQYAMGHRYRMNIIKK